MTTVTDARRDKTHDDKEFLRLEQLVATVHQVPFWSYPAAVAHALALPFLASRALLAAPATP
jgi:hypothetical protein